MDLTNKLETGDNETRLNAAAKLGKFGKPAASTLVEKIETNNSSSERTNSYMLLALLETGDSRAENILSENFGKKVASNKTADESTAEERTGREMSEDTLQAIEAKDKVVRKSLQTQLIVNTDEETDALEKALKSEIQNSSIYASVAFSDFGPEEPGSETEKLLKALKSEKGTQELRL